MSSAALALLLSAPGAPQAAAPTVEPRSSAAPAAPGKVFLTTEEALALAFPECVVTRGTEFLTPAQQERIAKEAGTRFEKGIVHPYVATREGALVGTAYFDSHVVRTLRETLMVVVDPAGKVARIELLAFGEPLDYVPRDAWYGQFLGRALDEQLELGRGIRSVTGATLTARATTRAAREVLATHALVLELERERERKKREREREKQKQKQKQKQNQGRERQPEPRGQSGAGQRP